MHACRKDTDEWTSLADVRGHPDLCVPEVQQLAWSASLVEFNDLAAEQDDVVVQQLFFRAFPETFQSNGSREVFLRDFLSRAPVRILAPFRLVSSIDDLLGGDLATYGGFYDVELTSTLESFPTKAHGRFVQIERFATAGAR